jgi:hypothetical protein
MGSPANHGLGHTPSRVDTRRLDRNLSPSLLGRQRLRRRRGGHNILSTPGRSGSGWLPLLASRPRHIHLPPPRRSWSDCLPLLALRPWQIHSRV